MWCNLKVSWNLFRFSDWGVQSKRNAYVLRRLRTPRLNKLGAVHPKKLKRQNYYFELIENTDVKKTPLLDLVLLKDVPGVGMFGERVQQSYFYGYKELLLPKLAVYADSPEAQNILRDTDEVHHSSKYSKIVENYLAGQAIPIILSHEIKWKLECWHVKVALRRAGILTNEECITLPPREIRGPNLEVENKDFLVSLTKNELFLKQG